MPPPEPPGERPREALLAALAERERELAEAREQQAAVAEVLQVINTAPGEFTTVFDAIAASAKRLLGGHSCAVGRIADDRMQLEAFTPTNPAGDAVMKAYYPRPYQPEGSRTAHSIARQGFAEMADVEAEADEALRDYARARGFRGFVTVPLRSEADQIGWMTVTREEPGRFAPHHIRLLQTFADQAVIAIQNARLFDAVQAKTRDLKESLRQQTATSEVLKVISRSNLTWTPS